MNVTVILCTYNRCRILATALESVAASTLPSAVAWEVLVVDNNSNDKTRQLVESFCRQYPGRFRYLFEPKAGKSYALNAGIRESRGDVLAFMDDDVSVEPTWLQNLIAPLLGSHEWSGSGGPVILRWGEPPPNWLAVESRYSLAPLAAFNPGDQVTELEEPPFGTNMAFRKSMFDKYGGFRTDLGPSPRTDIPRPDEDTEFGDRLIAGGERLRYEPSAIVYHPVPEDRLQKEYFLKWWFDKGRAEVRRHGNPATAISFRGVPMYLFRRLTVGTLRWMLATGPSHRFDCKVKVWGKLGAIRESRYQFARRRDSKERRESNAQL
jgi:glucosyl-dolichyl phosphate glucuronosyltransferase